MHTFRGLFLGSMTLLCLQVGCGPSTGPTGTVAGKLTKGGQPLSGITISFMGNTGASSAVTDGTGSYKLSTPIAVGSYRVSLTKVSAASTGPESGDYDALMSGKSAPAAAATDSTIPEKYQSTSTSKLQYEVKEGENSIDIAIE